MSEDRFNPIEKYLEFIDFGDGKMNETEIVKAGLRNLINRKNLNPDDLELVYSIYAVLGSTDARILEEVRVYLQKNYKRLMGNRRRQRNNRGISSIEKIPAMSEEELARIQSEMDSIPDDEFERIAKEQGWIK